jgi:hypothetical protein
MFSTRHVVHKLASFELSSHLIHHLAIKQPVQELCENVFDILVTRSLSGTLGHSLLSVLVIPSECLDPICPITITFYSKQAYYNACIIAISIKRIM